MTKLSSSGPNSLALDIRFLPQDIIFLRCMAIFTLPGIYSYSISWMHFLCCTIKGLGTMRYNRALGD